MIHLVSEYGPKKWTLIARHLKGRTGKQCRERYVAGFLEFEVLKHNRNFIWCYALTYKQGVPSPKITPKVIQIDTRTRKMTFAREIQLKKKTFKHASAFIHEWGGFQSK